MNTPDAAPPALPKHPRLPPGHPLAAKLEHWTKLRDELAQLNAHLEYLRLMLRINGGR